MLSLFLQGCYTCPSETTVMTTTNDAENRLATLVATEYQGVDIFV